MKKIASKILNNNNENREDLFLFNRIVINNYKITILIRSKIALIGIFSLYSSKGFQNLLLIHLYISLINFKGNSITKLNLINNYINNSSNSNYYSFQEFQNDKEEEITNNKIQNITKIDFLEISIYDKYFLKPCILHFEKVFKFLTKKEDINLTYTKFLDLYIIDIYSDNILFVLNEALNINSNNIYHKYYKNKNIFKEILFHSHQLYNSYTSKFGTKFIKADSSQRFIKVECTSTYPRILFIIKFIPVLKGVIVVHIYYQSKLSRGNNNSISINHENKYKEVDLVFGSFFGENGEMDLKYVMPKKLGNIEKFMEEFFITTRNSDLFKLNEPLKEFKYFNYCIINIINSISIDTIKTPLQSIIEYINEKIKEKYKEEYKNGKKKKSKKDTISEENNYRDSITIKSNKKSSNDSIDNSDKIFLLDKNILYNELFPNTKEKFTTIQNNFSTIKSNNKNIINILRESDSSFKNNNNFNMQKNNNEEKNKIVKMNTKTITLTSYSNLISKEEETSNKDIFQDFSLISSINKKDNNKVFKFKFLKNENTNFKNMNLQDLLNTSSTFKGNDTKEKFKHTEESVSDLISKDYSNNNIIIKKRSLKSKKSKQRSKLVLLNDDLNIE